MKLDQVEMTNLGVELDCPAGRRKPREIYVCESLRAKTRRKIKARIAKVRDLRGQWTTRATDRHRESDQRVSELSLYEKLRGNAHSMLRGGEWLRPQCCLASLVGLVPYMMVNIAMNSMPLQILMQHLSEPPSSYQHGLSASSTGAICTIPFVVMARRVV